MQKELLEALVRKGLSKEDTYSVMLVLTKEEKAKKMLSFLREKETLSSDEICEYAGFLAFEKNT